MKLDGFIGAAYKLESLNVDAQRCVNLYPEIIDSGKGKQAQRLYLRGTPGLESFLEVGDGPIRLIHRDSIGRILIVSGDELYRYTRSVDWSMNLYSSVLGSVVISNISSATDDSADEITLTDHGYYTGMKVQLTEEIGGTLPSPLMESTDYFIIRIDANTFQLASDFTNAFLGTQIDLTTTGSGGISIADQANYGNFGNINLTTKIDYVANTISIENHGLIDGVPLYIGSVATPLPTGLDHYFDGSNFTEYRVKLVDVDTIKLCADMSDVISDTEIDISFPSGSYSLQKIMSDDVYDPLAPNLVDILTSTGPMRAKSMSLGGDGTDSTTLIVDGVASYALVDQINDEVVSGVDGGVIVLDNSDLISLGQSPTPKSHVEWIDGFFITNRVDTNKFDVSNLKGIDFSALSFASSEGSPDLLMGLIANHRDLFIFNENTTEVYSNTGNADFPFERVQGGFFDVGCSAKYSIAKIDGTILWLGRSEEGDGIIYASRGSTPQRVSTHAIEQAISNYSDISSATAYTYQSEGHNFYVLNFDEATWVYDLSTGFWHERAYTNSGTLERHRSEVHCFDLSTGLHMVGDYESNKIYLLKNDVYSDNGDEITALRSAPHLTSDLDRVFYDFFQLDMEVGIGLDGSVQGSNPTVMLDFSNDGGHTWSSESYALADAGSGQIGDYKKRVKWNRLGSARDRIFRVKITDPVKRILIAANINVRKGAN